MFKTLGYAGSIETAGFGDRDTDLEALLLLPVPRAPWEALSVPLLNVYPRRQVFIWQRWGADEGSKGRWGGAGTGEGIEGKGPASQSAVNVGRNWTWMKAPLPTAVGHG